MKKPMFSLIVSGMSLGVVAPLVAQTTPESAQHPASQQGGGGSISTQFLMQNNGGSLLQATQPQQAAEAAPGERVGKMPPYDFYAIEAPEPHVLKKHDFVNIVVNEVSKSQTSGSNDEERTADFDAKVDAFVKFNVARLSLAGGAAGANPPEVKLEGARNFKGSGEYDRSDSMTTRLEAEVIDVKPNGTLVIEAKRHLKIDEEEVWVTLTGACRKEDVDASNSVLSTDLHDLDLQKATKGSVHDIAKRGIAQRILDLLAPF